jgi:competence protein ComEC
MNYWNETPLFRFLLVFISGILPAIYFPFISLTVALIVCCTLLLVFFLLYFFRKKLYSYRNRWLAGAVSYAAVFIAGYLLTDLNSEKNYPSHFRNQKSASAYMAFLEEPLAEKAKSYKTIIKIVSVFDHDQWKPATGNCIAYFAKDSSAVSLKYGDMILFQEKPVEVLPSANPSQFDYKRWLGFNKIFDQVFIPTGALKLLDHDRGNSLEAFSFSLRDSLLKIFSGNNLSGQDYAVLSALILGYEGDIDQETISAYAASGALHVLSVSGLHVGIIYIAINYFLGFLNYRRGTRLLKSILIILFLWFYALLTGLSPSVLRSAMMLSFIIIGKMTRQHTNLYNTLSASAFFLLVYNPFLIMQVGFQLSYIAVLGIILLQPPIYAWFDPPGWLLRQVWGLISVSIAAQVATFPLGLLYFHQFPVYFLLSNLVVIPISTLIIYGGILLLLISGWHLGAAVIGTITGCLVHCMNATVLFIEHLPYSLALGISLSLSEAWIMYITIGSFVTFLIKKDQKYFVIAGASVAVLFASQVIESWNLHHQKQLVVYSVKGKSVLNIIDGMENYISADDSFLLDRSAMLFNVYHYWWDCGLDENKVTTIHDGAIPRGKILSYRNFIQYENFKIVRVSDTVMLTNADGKIEVDFLILSQNVKARLKSVLKHFTCRFLVIDSSNSLSRSSGWMKESKELGIPAYSVLSQGAFVFNLSRE